MGANCSAATSGCAVTDDFVVKAATCKSDVPQPEPNPFFQMPVLEHQTRSTKELFDAVSARAPRQEREKRAEHEVRIVKEQSVTSCRSQAGADMSLEMPAHSKQATICKPCNVIEEHEQCALCLQSLSGLALGACIDCEGHRVCPHYFHYACLRRVHPRRCPQCREPFSRPAVVPNISENPRGWAQRVALQGGPCPNRKEVLAAFVAMLSMPSAEVEALLMSTAVWHEPVLTFDVERLQRLADALQQHIPLPPTFPEDDDYDEPHIVTSRPGHSNTAPGEVCSCGRIHVFRGDRVRRSQAWRGPTEELAFGELGTIVGDEDGLEGVVHVQWDLAPHGDVQSYVWPEDASLHEVEHVPFTEIPAVIAKVQAQTGLSSAASATFLRLSAAEQGARPSENYLRVSPKLFHRCRVLPEQALVQSLFEECQTCQCSEPGCRGGVHWNPQAARHVGMEGYVLDIDEEDETVLVEMVGRCNCQVWYPMDALEAVHHSDMAVEPRFGVGTAVHCRIDGAWHPGVVTSVRWRPPEGWGNQPSAPYAVTLDNGRSVWVVRDIDRLIRRRRPQALL